jgi:homoserine dehydrogenase
VKYLLGIKGGYKMVNIAVLGYGIVGSGVAEVIRKNGISISKKAEKEIKIKKILDIRDFPDSPDRELIQLVSW